MILFEVISFRLDQALMLPKTDEESIFLYKKAVSFSTLFALVVAIAWILYYFSPFYKSEYFQLSYLPISIFLQGLIQPSTSYSNRVGKYKLINIARVIQAIIMGIVSCLPFILKTQEVYLIEGYVAGQAFSLLVYSKLTYNNLTQRTSPYFSIQPYKQFPKYGTWSSLLNTISRNSVVYILNVFFSPFFVGIYTFTNRVVQVPLNLIAGAVGQAFFRDAGQAQNFKEQRLLTDYVQKLLTQMAILPVIIALLFGPVIFEFIFGSEWRAAGEVARYLSLWYGTSLVVTPLSTMIDIKGRLKWELKYNIFYTIARISLLIIFGYWGDFKMTLLAFCTISVAFNLYLLIFVRQIVSNEN